MQILQSILNNDDLDTESFLIKNGMVMFFLNAMFEKSQPKRFRVEIVKMLRYKLEEIEHVIGAFMPIHFFTLMEYQKPTMPTSEDEMLNMFINHLDDLEYENPFVMWNSDLKEQ